MKIYHLATLNLGEGRKVIFIQSTKAQCFNGLIEVGFSGELCSINLVLEDRILHCIDKLIEQVSFFRST
jgi:hypothetical protein